MNVGIDLVEIERIRKSSQKGRFMERVFSEKESALFLTKKNPFETMAGHWAVKEAFSKAVKTGVRDFSLNEISVLRDELGAPYLELTGKKKDAVYDVEFKETSEPEKEENTEEENF